MPQRTDLQLGELGAYGSELAVGDAGALGAAQQRLVQFPGSHQLGVQLHQAGDLVDEPRIDTRSGCDLSNRRTQPQGPLSGVEPAVMRHLQRRQF
jgi:hypothetical protein